MTSTSSSRLRVQERGWTRHWHKKSSIGNPKISNFGQNSKQTFTIYICKKLRSFAFAAAFFVMDHDSSTNSDPSWTPCHSKSQLLFHCALSTYSRTEYSKFLLESSKTDKLVHIWSTSRQPSTPLQTYADTVARTWPVKTNAQIIFC